jgi:hypothetical protein
MDSIRQVGGATIHRYNVVKETLSRNGMRGKGAPDPQLGFQPRLNDLKKFSACRRTAMICAESDSSAVSSIL